MHSFSDDSEGWVVTQLGTTMDVDCYRWLDWFHGGLQFQVATLLATVGVYYKFYRLYRWREVVSGLKIEGWVFCSPQGERAI